MSYSYEIFNLFNRVALERGLRQDFVESILKKVNILQTEPLISVEVGLKVDGLKYPLEFYSDKEGKVFELRGTNTRYKTTTILIMGFLLGCDWTNQTQYLNNYKLESQIEEVKALFFTQSITIEMYIKNTSISIFFIKKDDILDVIIDGEKKYTRSLKNFEFDMQEYQRVMSKYFKVQFISKGRDFVTQVHHEILENVKNSFDYITSNGREILSKFMSTRQRKIYTKSLKEYENDIVVLLTLKKMIDDFIISAPQVKVLGLFDYIRESKSIEEELIELRKRELLIQHKLEAYRSEKDKLLSEGLVNESAVKSPSNWVDPIRNIKECLLHPADKFDGNDLVPLYVEMMGKPVKKVSNKSELVELFQTLEEEQSMAVQYFDVQDKYKRLYELKRLIEIEESSSSAINAEIKRLDNLLKRVKETTLDDINIQQLLPKIKTIQTLTEKTGLVGVDDVEEIKLKTKKRIDELSEIISEIKFSNSKEEYIPYEILNSILFEFNSVKSLLVAKSGNKTILNSSIKETAEESHLYSEVITLFNNLMKERCKYYYKVSDDKVESIELQAYDFESRMLTTLDGDEISARYGLSGGIDSAMTVRSLASSQNDAFYGTVVLVDEWGDVSEKLAREVYKTLSGITQMAFGLFVKISEDEQAKIYSIDR